MIRDGRGAQGGGQAGASAACKQCVAHESSGISSQEAALPEAAIPARGTHEAATPAQGTRRATPAKTGEKLHPDGSKDQQDKDKDSDALGLGRQALEAAERAKDKGAYFMARVALSQCREAYQAAGGLEHKQPHVQCQRKP